MAERINNHMFQRWMNDACRYEEPWRKANEQCYAYYDGDQWTEEEKTQIDERGQQPTVINTIQPTIDMIRSIEVDRRVDFQICGREGSDDNKSDLLTALLKHVLDVCNFDYFHSAVFLDGLIGGRGWMECDKYTDERGKDMIKVENIPWENVYLDPFSRKPDASDARFIIKTKWVDRDVLKKLFPESADNIDSVFDNDFKGQEYEAQNKAGDRGIGNYYDHKTQRVKVCYCYYTMPEYEDVKVLNEKTGEEETKSVLKQNVHFVIFSDEIILQGSAEKHSQNKNPLGINYYPLIPIYCMRDRKGRPRGIVQGLIDIQDQINKLNSKFLWTVATNRVIIEEGAANDPEKAQEEYQKPDGFVILNDGGLGKIKIDDKSRDLSYMANHLNFLLSTEQRISGVNDSMLGLGGTNERSGIMQSTRISQGSAMQTSILENLFFSKQRIALVLLRLIGKYYTDYRVLRITQPNGTTDKYEFNKPVIDPETGKPTSLLNSIEDTLYYDVILKKVPPFNSMRERQLLLISEVLKSGVVIPPQVAAKIILGSMDLPNKSDLLLEIENFYKDQAVAQAQMQAQGLPPK